MTTTPLITESLTLLNVCGLNPKYQNSWTKTLFAVMILLFTFMIVEVAIPMYINWQDLDSMDGMTSLSAWYQIALKALIMVAKNNVFMEVFNKIELFWPLNKYGSELEDEIKNTYKSVKKYLKIFAVVLTITVTAYFLRPFFTPTRTTALQTYHPTDPSKSPEYELWYIFQLLIVISGCTCILGFDSLFISLITYVTCELKKIKKGFNKMKVEEETTNEVECLKKVKKLIDHHNLVLGFIKNLEEIYSFLLLNQFLASMLLICAGLLSIIADGFPPDLIHFSKYFTLLVTYSGQLFFYCAAGNHLITESESVSEAVYATDWYVKTQPNLRRAFTFTIQRANKTEKLTAGGMFILNLETFTKVLRLSMSFFTLIQAVYTKSEQT